MRNILIRLKESLKLVYPSKFGYRFLRCSAIISSFLGLACLAFSLIFLFNAGDVNFSGRIDLVKAGPIGDFIGGFIGIFWTISGVLLLFITLRMQADEFKATRDAVTKQQFESSFFNMLAILRTIRSELSIQSVNQSGIPTSLKGDEFFSYLNKVLNHSIFLKSHFSLDVVTKEVFIKTANLDESILLSDVQVFRGKLAGFIK
ncbi:hypothetical protein QWY85_15925 [Neolewinella lacunae]|uniref:Uncharacterized protein n=1 Tax=Neolewinella lacunae TaxID=1517758 RepID=A0A923PHV2_9BACT|nr:hypothetical protein [Neolewinella lacunae]MBC6993569.1 hypothetical protein [Neolewinella lacunae]MDN3636156.1 hypothetical protein [Neolewinella lacunae]